VTVITVTEAADLGKDPYNEQMFDPMPNRRCTMQGWTGDPLSELLSTSTRTGANRPLMRP
jgi:hypothetical protein